MSNKVTVKNTVPIASPQSMGILFVWQKALLPVKMQHRQTRENKILLKGRYAIAVKYRRQQHDNVLQCCRMVESKRVGERDNCQKFSKFDLQELRAKISIMQLPLEVLISSSSFTS